jgi:hypothetical protein
MSIHLNVFNMDHTNSTATHIIVLKPKTQYWFHSVPAPSFVVVKRVLCRGLFISLGTMSMDHIITHAVLKLLSVFVNQSQ